MYETSNKKNVSKLTACIMFNLLLIIFLILMPFYQEDIYFKNYLVDMFCTMGVMSLCLNYSVNFGFDLFDPIYTITFIYGFLYFVTPIYDILSQKYYWYGYSMFPYGIKATLIAFAGYISFYIAYSGKTNLEKEEGASNFINNKLHTRMPISEKKNQVDEKEREMIPLILVLYVVSFAANVYYLIHSGYTNLLYIMSLGLLGNEGGSAPELSSIGFVAMFSYCLPTLVLLYWQCSKRSFVTLLLFIPMLMMQVARGFRFFIVQIAITFASYYFLTKHKRPKLRQILMLFFTLMIPVVVMTMFRNDIRSGAGITISQINMESIKKAFSAAIWDNFRVYNNYYGVVHMVPRVFGYVYGRQIFGGIFIMMIPRIIWPNKISPGAGADISQIIGINLFGTGQAYPGLGEYYYAFGVAGVIIFMALYGLIVRYIRNRYLYGARNGYDIIAFSVLLGANLQILIRGYTPSNFWYVVFSLLPVVIIKTVNKSILESDEQ